MSFLAAGALLGVGLQGLGAIQANRNKKFLSKLRSKELDLQFRLNAEVFKLNLEQLKTQQTANRGMQASQFAKAGVDTGSGSALALVSEQARVDSLNASLFTLQHKLNQRANRVDSFLNKRTGQQLDDEMFLTIASSLVGGFNASQQAGGFNFG